MSILFHTYYNCSRGVWQAKICRRRLANPKEYCYNGTEKTLRSLYMQKGRISPERKAHMKKIFIIILALVMAAACAACSSPRTSGEVLVRRTESAGQTAPSPTPFKPSPGSSGMVKISGDPVKRIDSLASLDPEKNKIDCLRWETFVSGGSAALPAVTREVFTDYKAFAEKYGERLGSAAEYYKQDGGESVFIIAVTCTVNTGGYTFGLNSAFVRDGVAYIDVKREAPGAKTNVTQAFENHTVLIAFDSSLFKEGMTCEITVNGQSENLGTGDKM